MKRKKRNYQNVDYAPANILRRLKQESFQKRRSILKIVAAVIIAAVSIKLLVGPFGTLELVRMYQKKRMLDDRIKYLSTELANLEWQTRQLSNPLYIEKLAREKYWMLKPGEIIIKLPQDLMQK
jgi:cell division protein FtsB